MKHVLVKWESEDTWEVYPVKRAADVAIGMDLLRDPARSQASTERKWNRLALEAAVTDSPATGAKRTCDHLEQIKSLEKTVGSLKKEVQELKEELAQARQCTDASRMVKRLKDMLENASTPAEPVDIAAAPKVDIGDGVCVEEGLLKRLRLDANNSGSRFARSLLKALFTKEELEGRSLFGWTSNAHKGLPQKEPLDSKKVNAILDYTTQNFSVLPGQLKNSLSLLLTRGY
ncbi:uncharacterized protein LOC142567983 [Dermacentor variabilis]|uniref:uncharacterized protein LOC142567983 n=1 Tax=Dermacentor variabilis TaxID=34621 RepID=UPI003F5C161A